MDAIEKRARKLLAAHVKDSGYIVRESEAIAAIIAALTPPEGYVLAPVKPTDAMWDSGDVAGDWGFQYDGKSRFKNGNCGEIWAAMLAARPEVQNVND